MNFDTPQHHPDTQSKIPPTDQPFKATDRDPLFEIREDPTHDLVKSLNRYCKEAIIARNRFIGTVVSDAERQTIQEKTDAFERTYLAPLRLLIPCLKDEKNVDELKKTLNPVFSYNSVFRDFATEYTGSSIPEKDKQEAFVNLTNTLNTMSSYLDWKKANNIQ